MKENPRDQQTTGPAQQTLPRWFHSFREASKLSIRGALLKRNLGIAKDPAPSTLARMLDHYDIDSVLDVGANVGQFGSLLRRAGYGRRIYSFEPGSFAYRLLAKRAADDGNWLAKRCAIGEVEGWTHLNLSENLYSSSVLDISASHEAVAPRSRYIGKEAVSVQTLEGVARTFSLDPSRVFVKVDVQGYELPVLNGGRSFINEVAAVQLELSLVPLYRGQVMGQQLYSMMIDRGFTIFSVDPGISDRTGRMLQCDVVFVRTSLLDE